MYNKTIFWFREDLRINDNAGLWHALKNSKQVLCIYNFNKNETDEIGFNNKRREFIWNCVKQLKTALRANKSDLYIFHDVPEHLIPNLIQQFNIEAVFCNELYTPSGRQEEYIIENSIKKLGVKFHSYNDSTIFSKNDILDSNGEVFTTLAPYSKAWLKKLSPEYYQFFSMKNLTKNLFVNRQSNNIHPTELKLSRTANHNEATNFGAAPEYASKIFEQFLLEKIGFYAEKFEYPAEQGNSYLSIHLNQGLLSIRQTLSLTLALGEKYPNSKIGCNTWINQLIQRDFYCQLAYHHPRFLFEPYHSVFDGFPWDMNMKNYYQWCVGQTGYPLIDAAMRNFNKTGFMHPMLRKLTSSFLTKHLLIDYRLGEKYFAEKSLDYNQIFNNAGWQWAASTMPESQSFFKIINPITFSEKYDPEGKFIKMNVPELRLVDNMFIHNPYKHRKELLSVGIKIGEDYPMPIVDNHAARQKAIWLFEQFARI